MSPRRAAALGRPLARKIVYTEGVQLDGNDGVVFKKQLDFTDFPLDEICFYVINKTLLLPSEY